jgi:predicted AlkP superfamily phosphohydrolase/phosphomutase
MRTLVIGMDAGDLPFVRACIDRGKLPTLKAMTERGALARLQVVQPFSPEAAWATIVTGCVPGKHGIYNWRQIVPGTNRMARTPGRTYRQPFWTQLRRGGEPQDLLLVDVPYAPPLEEEGVTQVIGWGMRGGRRQQSWPEDLLDRVHARHGRYPLGLDQDHHGRRRAGRRLLRALQDQIKTRGQLAIELTQEHPWDLAVIAFSELHHGGHAFHRYVDERTLGHDIGHRWHSSSLLDLYQVFDDAVGGLIDAVGPDVNTIVISGFGMRPNTNGPAALERVMTGLGYYVPTRASSGTQRAEWMRRVALEATPGRLRRWVNQRLLGGASERHVDRLWFESTDWDRTVAFSLSEPGHSFVQLARPEPAGADALLDEIAGELRQLTDADTGEPAVTEILRRNEVSFGPNVHVLPDLSVHWSLRRYLLRLRHPRIGVVEDDLSRTLLSEHTEEGFMIAAGPQIPERSEDAIGGWVDVAPTLLHLHDRPIPEEMDGEPLELFGDSHGPPRREQIDIADKDPWRGL